MVATRAVATRAVRALWPLRAGTTAHPRVVASATSHIHSRQTEQAPREHAAPDLHVASCRPPVTLPAAGSSPQGQVRWADPFRTQAREGPWGGVERITPRWGWPPTDPEGEGRDSAWEPQSHPAGFPGCSTALPRAPGPARRRPWFDQLTSPLTHGPRGWEWGRVIIREACTTMDPASGPGPSPGNRVPPSFPPSPSTCPLT